MKMQTMKPYFYAFICLVFTSCVIVKKQVTPIDIKDLNTLPLSNSSPKCVVFKSKPETNYRTFVSPAEYFYFFTESNIYFKTYDNDKYWRTLGYYDFEINEADSNTYLHLTRSVKTTNNMEIVNKYVKNSLDSIYLHFKISTIEGLPFNEKNPLIVEKALSPRTIQGMLTDSFVVSVLANSADSSEFVVALKRDSNTNYLSVFYGRTLFSIDSINNYYEIRGATCYIYREVAFPQSSYEDHYYYQIKKISRKDYEITQIRLEDNTIKEQGIYTWQNANSLHNYKKEYLYMLPTFIKILECSGAYPRK